MRRCRPPGQAAPARAQAQKFETAQMLYIHPDECIDCGACVPACPVEAIFSEANTPAQWTNYLQINAERSAALKDSGHITEKQDAKAGPACKKK